MEEAFESTQRLVSNAEIQKRNDLIKNGKNRIEPLYFNYSDEKNRLNKARKSRNKNEPFDYNRANEEFNANDPLKALAIKPEENLNGLKFKNIKKSFEEPFNYNYEKKMVNKNHEKLRLANTSPFALFGNLNETNSNSNNDVIAYCDKCNQFIDDNKEKCTHNNQTFHKKCFRCAHCFTELIRMKKVLSSDKSKDFYCEPCYSKEFGPKCPKCSEPIASYMLTTSYENKLYHKECFVCQRCKKYMVNEQFHKTGKIILCRNCF